MKRPLRTAAGGILGIFLTVALLESGASVIQGRQNTATPDFTLETPDLADIPDLSGETNDDGGRTDCHEAASDDRADNGMAVEGMTIDPTGKSIRDVAPEQFGPAEEVTAQPLQRIEPRTPLSDPLAKPRPVPSVLRHPVALSAGLIQFDGGRLLQLEGLVSQTADRTCDDNGKSWPCGQVARTEFRNFLRARALICKVPADGWQGTLIATCTVNRTDPALWLAERGWAEAEAGSPFADKVKAAKKSGLGFFGKDPRDFSAAPVPLDSTGTDAATGTQPAGPDL